MTNCIILVIITYSLWLKILKLFGEKNAPTFLTFSIINLNYKKIVPATQFLPVHEKQCISSIPYLLLYSSVNFSFSDFRYN